MNSVTRNKWVNKVRKTYKMWPSESSVTVFMKKAAKA